MDIALAIQLRKQPHAMLLRIIMIRAVLVGAALLGEAQASPTLWRREEIAITSPSHLSARLRVGSATATVRAGAASVCDIIDPDIPSECTCAPKHLGGVLTCAVNVIDLDTIGVKFDMVSRRCFFSPSPPPLTRRVR